MSNGQAIILLIEVGVIAAYSLVALVKSVR